MAELPTGVCGHPVSNPRSKKCRACWQKRGPDLKPEERVQHVGRICGHPVVESGSDYCSACYDTKRPEIVAARAGVYRPEEGIRRILKTGPKSLVDIAKLMDRTPGATLDALLAMRAGGVNLHEFQGQWSLERIIQQPQERIYEYVSRPDNTFHFGIASDQHLCSRYAREDVLGDLYDAFARDGVDRVFNAGNWIDGEDEKNRFDLAVHGLEPQIDYLVEHYPKRDGITTYAVWGEDHEGWFSRRESIDVGRFAQGKMRTAGRQDWIDLGFVEARVDLVNANTGARATLVVMHPGGGSSYAYSYRPQKLVESLCVPIDADALTPLGWKRRADLKVGDLVLGYNQSEDICQWTTITALNDSDAETVEYENQQFKVRVTENHRWAMQFEHRAGPNPNSREPQPYSKLYTGIGTIAEYRTAWRRARIVQAAVGPEGTGYRATDSHEFMDRDGAVAAVLRMTSAQRQAFILGLMYGEGTLAPTRNSKGTPVFSQRPGAVNDGFRLACFLEGIATGGTTLTSKKINGDDKVCGRTSILRKRLRMVDSFREGARRTEQVWCPTTTLGTWVMRQGDTITITGNSGGEKPSILVIGHYHKMSCNLIRNVWTIQAGCQQDQSLFMRKKSLEAHIGGHVVIAEQDPQTGAIFRCVTDQRCYFDKSYYNDRWSKTQAVVQAPRFVGGVTPIASRHPA